MAQMVALEMGMGLAVVVDKDLIKSVVMAVMV
jgi:hypothetical protein